MSLIKISNLTFGYEGSYDDIFKDVNLQIDTNWKLGLTGRNGAGKTTFLNLLLGQYDFSGSISAEVCFEYFPYQVCEENKTVIDIITEICVNVPQWEITREISLLALSQEVLDRPFKSLSGGERAKVLLASLFLKENSFLLIDEPTNHLDMIARKTVTNYLRDKNGFILVSHDRDFLDNCIDHVLAFNKTDIELQQGNFTSWFTNKQRRDAFEIAENKRLKKEINHLQEASKRVANWSNKLEKTKKSGPDRGYIGHKAAKLMARSKAIENRQQSAIVQKSKLLRNIETTDSLKLSPLTYHKNTLVSLHDVSIFYNGITACHNVNFAIESGERIALCGSNGTGKSSLIKLINGDNIEYSGELYVGSNLIISYVSQDTSSLKGSLTEYPASYSIDDSLFKTILRKLGFSRVQFEKDIADFSAGQKKKVLIARSLCEKAHLYIWDEPLNYIDLISRLQIEELLLKYKITILFVEHDNAFCNNIATKQIRLPSM